MCCAAYSFWIKNVHSVYVEFIFNKVRYIYFRNSSFTYMSLSTVVVEA